MESNLKFRSLMSMIEDRIGWHKVPLPIDYNHYNLNTSTFTWENIFGRDTVLWGKWFLLWLLQSTLWLGDLEVWT